MIYITLINYVNTKNIELNYRLNKMKQILDE